MAIHSGILVWRIPWREEPGGLQSTESKRVGHDWSNLACTHSDYEVPFFRDTLLAFCWKSRASQLFPQSGQGKRDAEDALLGHQAKESKAFSPSDSQFHRNDSYIRLWAWKWFMDSGYFPVWVESSIEGFTCHKVADVSHTDQRWLARFDPVLLLLFSL